LTEDEAVRLAIDTLAKEIHVEVDAIEVGKVVETEWSDSSLGCPQKGMMYAQVMTPGYLVTLVIDGEHSVHVGGGNAVVCRNGARGSKVVGRSRQITMSRLFQAARKDLARRLDVPATEIEVSFMGPKIWPDASLGCPEPGENYESGEVKGYLIVLEYRGKTYPYHADEERTLLCENE
jgi:hypothetical protein